MIGEFVLVRTRSAGVHCGTLGESHGTAVLLADARRVWSWTGAFSLHEMSVRGCSEQSRISAPVRRIVLTEAIEVIPCEEAARLNLCRSRNAP